MDQRRVPRDEACARYEAALRTRCDEHTEFDCAAYFDQAGAECHGEQRESDVARCERLIARSRSCDEALNQTCGTTCTQASWLPPLPG